MHCGRGRLSVLCLSSSLRLKTFQQVEVCAEELWLSLLAHVLEKAKVVCSNQIHSGVKSLNPKDLSNSYSLWSTRERHLNESLRAQIPGLQACPGRPRVLAILPFAMFMRAWKGC